MKEYRLIHVIVRCITFIGLFVAIKLRSNDIIINGNAAIANKRYNEVMYPASHNGHSHAEGPVQNQALTLREQFEKGIRATKIHVWYDHDAAGQVMPFACHGVTKDILDGPFLDKVVDKVPRLFRGWARDILKQMEPLNILVRDACKAAYGDDAQKGIIQFKHCILDPSARSLSVLLQEVKQFMDKNPSELLTLILEDHTNNLAHIAKDFEKNGLNGYLHAQSLDKSWPTLNEMVKAGKRLVVFLHGKEGLNYGDYPWMHYMWDYAWDTEWEFSEASDLKDTRKDCMPKRGQMAYKKRHEAPKNKVFIVHHFVTPLTGGCRAEAKKVNRRGFLEERLGRLMKEAGQIPNIVQVDFCELPNKDIIEVAHAMNARG